jgi:hypothetical protein
LFCHCFRANPKFENGISHMETLNKHFQTLAGPVFAKHGFAQGQVLSRWPEIVGADLAAFCAPEKIRWPRGANAQGGTLVVKAMAGYALDVEQSIPLILERIRQFLGHGSVQAVKVQPSHSLPPVKLKAAPPAEAPAHIKAATQAVADPDLQAALLRLGAAVSAEKPRSPQVSPQVKQASGTHK